MGVFTYPIEIGAAPEGPFLQFDAFVDSSAFYTQVPASVLHDLGVEAIDRAIFVMADGSRVESELGNVRIRIDGRENWTICVFAEEGTPALLGAYALEAFLLGVDPVAKRLIRVEGMRLHRRADDIAI